MSGDADLRLFMVEHNMGGLSAPQLVSAHQALAEAVRREARRGGQIRYVQRIFVPADGTCMCLFEAYDPDAVRAVSDVAQFALARVVAVTSNMRYRHCLRADIRKDNSGGDNWPHRIPPGTQIGGLCNVEGTPD